MNVFLSRRDTWAGYRCRSLQGAGEGGNGAGGGGGGGDLQRLRIQTRS